MVSSGYVLQEVERMPRKGTKAREMSVPRVDEGIGYNIGIPEMKGRPKIVGLYPPVEVWSKLRWRLVAVSDGGFRFRCEMPHLGTAHAADLAWNDSLFSWGRRAGPPRRSHKIAFELGDRGSSSTYRSTSGTQARC